MKVTKKSSWLPRAVEQRLLKEAKAVVPAAWELAQSMFARPELAYEEHFASKTMGDFLAERGFRIQRGTAGLKTAFTALLPDRPRRPAVGYLAEMDALPGLGHACGHHLIAGGSLGAAVALVRALPRSSGAVKLIACPAEEAGGGKVELSRAGAFSGLDAALIVHPERTTEIYKRSYGMVEIRLVFLGKAAHAAAEPEEGVNALDAVIQTFNAVSLMRQQMPDWNRVHGIITEGGAAPNIIPKRTAAVFLARGLSVKETTVLAERVVKCAQGAAKATGARLRAKVRWDRMYAPYVPNRALGETFRRALNRLGLRLEQGPEDKGLGSTDVGNVGLQAPVLHPMIKVPGAKDGCHTPDFAQAAGGPGGKVMLGHAIASLALTGAKVLLDAGLRERIHQEHHKFLQANN